MTDPHPPFDPAALDAPRPAACDPAVLAANLAALERVAPALATDLRAAALPPHWRCVHALDDTLTFRTELPGTPPAWLGGTAAPRTRAAALLSEWTPTGRNVALPTATAGGELVWLLSRLPPHIAVYVFEADAPALLALLHLHDLTRDIAQGRCLLLPPQREEAALGELLAAKPGLLPPGNILLADLVPPDHLEALRRLCERVHAATLQSRARHLAELHARRADSRDAGPPGSGHRLALLALTAGAAARVTAGAVAQAAHSEGCAALACILAGPDTADPVLHATRVAEFEPTLTICLGHAPAALPLPLRGRVAVWHLGEYCEPPARDVAGVLHLAATPQIAAALRRAGIAADALHEWHWGAPDVAPGPDPEPGLRTELAADGLILMADLPDPQPGSHGIRQPSHLRLWSRLHELSARRWQDRQPAEPAAMLREAERTTGISIVDPDLRPQLLRLLESVLIPFAVLRAIATTLLHEPVPLRIIGRGWEQLSDLPAACSAVLAPGVFELGEGPRLQPLACVLAGGSAHLGPELLHAAAHAWPLLIHGRPGRLSADMGDTVKPNEHVQVFQDLVELRAALESVRAGEPAVAQRAARAAAHVRAVHSYRRRVRDLLTLIERLP